MSIEKFVLSFILYQCSLWSLAQPNSLEEKLFHLPDVRFERIEDHPEFESVYLLYIKQPLDHLDPGAGYFDQKVYLSHKGFDEPTVMCTEGYQRPRNRIYELTRILNGNQLDIEHRYFGESIPDSIDYRYLTLEQVTADLHRINQLFRTIYTGKWVSTGISKGGQTTLFYRYFHPDDVDVSVPYVAPLNLSLKDERIYTFLDTVGTESCRQLIKDVQHHVLTNYDEALDKVRWYSNGARLQFGEYLTLEEAFEYTVLEYPFSFWQWGGDCELIPDMGKPLDDIVQHLLDICDISFFADGDMMNYASHYYQAGSQMGYYGYDIAEFKDELRALPVSSNPSAVFMPSDLPLTFDGKLPQKLYDWLTGPYADRIVYIYGASDTWSATAVPPSDEPDALWFFLPGKDHAKARIENMEEMDRQRLNKKLGEWLQIQVD